MKKLQSTGNPFVDVGLATASIYANHFDISSLTHDELRATVQYFVSNMTSVQNLRVLTHYWQNSPFVGKNLSQKTAYERNLHSLADGTVKKNENSFCQICGDKGALPINRCWLPLAGSPDSDPCTLPSLEAKMVCPDCFCAILLLPLGCRTCKTGPYLYHTSDASLQVEVTKFSVQSIKQSILARASSDKGLKEETTLSNRLELLEIASKTRWGNELSRLPVDGLMMVSFSNSGTSPRANNLHLPAQALKFFEGIQSGDVLSTFLSFARESSDKKHGFHDQLCNDIETRRSFAPMLAAITKSKLPKKQIVTPKERLMLKIYEDLALKRKDRFEALERIADSILQLDEDKRASIIKVLYLIKTESALHQLLALLNKKYEITFARADLQTVYTSPWREAVSLLYLLCVATKTGDPVGE